LATANAAKFSLSRTAEFYYKDVRASLERGSAKLISTARKDERASNDAFDFQRAMAGSNM
jgi:hypothetical protein